MSVYTKSIQETNYATVENHQPAVLFKFAMYKLLFYKCRCDFSIHDNGLIMSQETPIVMSQWVGDVV